MRSMLNIFFASILAVSVGTLVAAPLNGESQSVENKKAATTLDEAVKVLNNVMEDPANGIPQSLINKSEGIVIFPGACMVAAGPVNGSGGIGTAMIHEEDGSWSNPFFVTLREGNLELQIGPQTSDIVLLFKDRNDIFDIEKARIILGGDVGIAPGPVNIDTYSSSDIPFEADIYSYHLSKGFFTGESFQGGIMSYHEKLSDSLYGIDAINMGEIFYKIEIPYNDKVNDLIAAINMRGE